MRWRKGKGRDEKEEIKSGVGCVGGWTVREEMRYECMITEIGRRGRKAMQIEQTTQHSTTLSCRVD